MRNERAQQPFYDSKRAQHHHRSPGSRGRSYGHLSSTRNLGSVNKDSNMKYRHSRAPRQPQKSEDGSGVIGNKDATSRDGISDEKDRRVYSGASPEFHVYSNKDYKRGPPKSQSHSQDQSSMKRARLI